MPYAAPLEPLRARRIITGMRALLLVLMIVLLPLRGWMGDAMAMNTATGAQIATQTIADNDPATLGTAHFDAQYTGLALAGALAECLDHVAKADAATGPALSGAPLFSAHPDCVDCGDASHDNACNACQVCHTVAMSTGASSLSAFHLPALAPATAFPSFTSALPAPGLKPPIS